MSNVYIGIFFAALASTMNATGLNLQRYGQRYQEKGGTQSKIWGRRINAFGVFLSTACGLVDVISYGYAPQTTLAPFGSFTLVVNLVLAPTLHGEEIVRIDFISTALVMTGLIISLLSGSKPAIQLDDVEELSSLLFRPICFAYACFLVCFIIGSGIHVLSNERKGLGNRKIVGAFYPLIAGTFASSTALTVKVVTQLIKLGGSTSTIAILVLFIIGFAISNMTVNNRGLGKHPPLLIVPIFSTTFLVTNIIGGGVFFDEFAVFTNQQWIMYGIGISFIIAGVLLGATKKAATKNDAQKSLKRQTSMLKQMSPKNK